MAVEYVLSLLDPFQTTVSQPKLLDGSVTRSSGVRFRNTGQITLAGTTTPCYIVVLPGISQSLSWNSSGGVWSNPTAYPSHLGTSLERANISRWRLVNSGLKISLMNSSDDNEGYWEAIRVPYQNVYNADLVAPIGEDGLLLPDAPFDGGNWANYETYQTGRLRDIHRMQFKLNSVNPVHEWKKPFATNPSNVSECLDETFDVLIIRIFGRVDATTPSTIMYETSVGHEVEYKQGTALSRLMTTNVMVPDLDVVLDKTRYMLPAIQVA